jgi:hypothetical protein
MSGLLITAVFQLLAENLSTETLGTKNRKTLRLLVSGLESIVSISDYSIWDHINLFPSVFQLLAPENCSRRSRLLHVSKPRKPVSGSQKICKNAGGGWDRL